MSRYIARRSASSLLVLFLVSVLTFLIFQVIPNGDPALRIAGRGASPQTLAAVVEQWGFDQPLHIQYLLTMKQVFTGSVVSYSGNLNVLDQIKAGLPATLSLAVGTAVLWMTVSVLLGAFTARQAGRASDRLLGILAVVGVSVPVYVVAAGALYLFAYRLSIFPNGGYVPITESFSGWFSHLLLPWACLSIGFIGFYSRILRSTILETMREDFVRTARAKGLSENQVMRRHVLRLSLVPLISLWGLDFAGVVGGGAILVETLFNLQGVGQYAAQSIGLLDVPPILVIVMYGSFFVVLLSAVVDVVHALAEPRVRLNA